MSKIRFIARLLLVMCSIALFQIITSEALVYLVVHPTFGDTVKLLTLPGPVVFLFLAAFTFLVYLYLRPVLRFLDEARSGRKPEEKFVRSVQDQVSTFPYFMAFLAYPFYMAGSSAATWIICRRLGWPMETVFYGFLGGLLCSLLATPVAIYGYTWQIQPVLSLSNQPEYGIEPARSAGRRIPVMIKLVVTVLSLVIACTGYAVIVGYKQNDAILANMKRMEQLLPESSRAGLVQKNLKTADPGIKSAEYYKSQVGNLSIFYISIMSFAVLVSLVLAIAAGMNVTRPLRTLIHAALQIREGNYGEPVRLISNDELSELGSAFNQMEEKIILQIRSMEKVVDGLKAGIDQIDETVNTIVSVSKQQSMGATSQASALQETSTISKEIARAAKDIEERAKVMDGVASSTLSSSQEGKQKLDRSREEFNAITEQMEAIQRAMAELEVRFRETYTIVALIKDMAEKTEILSLNASIEAAGAGLEGRRFMVVAEETRMLATKSAEAVRQIKDLVAVIQRATVESISVTEQGKSKVLAGGKTIESALESLKTISSFAESTFSAVKEITDSTAAQRRASEQLAGSVGEIYDVSKQVEKGAQEINSAVNALQGFAESLRKTVQQENDR